MRGCMHDGADLLQTQFVHTCALLVLCLMLCTTICVLHAGMPAGRTATFVPPWPCLHRACSSAQSFHASRHGSAFLGWDVARSASWERRGLGLGQ